MLHDWQMLWWALHPAVITFSSRLFYFLPCKVQIRNYAHIWDFHLSRHKALSKQHVLFTHIIMKALDTTTKGIYFLCDKIHPVVLLCFWSQSYSPWCFYFSKHHFFCSLPFSLITSCPPLLPASWATTIHSLVDPFINTSLHLSPIYYVYHCESLTFQPRRFLSFLLFHKWVW